MLIVKAITVKTKQIVWEHAYSSLCSNQAIPAIFTSSILSVHSSTNLPTNFFLNLQFSESKYSPASHDYHIHTHNY